MVRLRLEWIAHTCRGAELLLGNRYEFAYNGLLHINAGVRDAGLSTCEVDAELGIFCYLFAIASSKIIAGVLESEAQAAHIHMGCYGTAGWASEAGDDVDDAKWEAGFCNQFCGESRLSQKRR